MLINILFIIILCCLFGSNYNESFSNQFCILSNFDHKSKFTPINMILNNIMPFKFSKNGSSIISATILSIQDINDILASITINKYPNNFTELSGFRYNLVDPPKITYISHKVVDELPKKLFKIISAKFQSKANSKTKQCNKNTPCQFTLKRVTILKVGKNKENYVIEGQLLISLKFRNFDYLIRFVITDIGGVNIHYLKLEGYNFPNHFGANPSIKNVEIYREPLINTYNADKTYMVSSNETKILKDTSNMKPPNNKYNYRCYGKVAINKNECEKKYDSFGKMNTITGSWDKPCSTDTDCPFYKANKNYPNTLGGCVNYKCTMPIGISSKSPIKYTGIGKAVCGNCKSGMNCCISQQNRKLYPLLKSPDYRFDNDADIRMKYPSEAI
jgi:hypothetical protein